MKWTTIVGAVVIFGILGALLLLSRKDKKPPRDGRMTTEALSERSRLMWEEAEQAIAAHKHARGDEVGPARERMLRVADEADRWVGQVEANSGSERQVLMAKLTAEEIREFVNDALAQHSEGRQS